jgi:hypothetical protein
MIAVHGKLSHQRKNLDELQGSFTAEHREFRLTSQIENYIYQGTVDAMSQIAEATASDRETVDTLTSTNDKLTLQLETSQAYVKKLKEDTFQLKLMINPAWKGQQPSKTMDNDSFCWPRDYQVHNEHTSASCNNQKEGNKKEATKKNPIGGVKWGKE